MAKAPETLTVKVAHGRVPGSCGSAAPTAYRPSEPTTPPRATDTSSAGSVRGPGSATGSGPKGLEVVGDPADGLGEHLDVGQRHQSEVVGLEPVEAGAMGDQDL